VGDGDHLLRFQPAWRSAAWPATNASTQAIATMVARIQQSTRTIGEQSLASNEIAHQSISA
jgi:hypothetical protein